MTPSEYIVNGPKEVIKSDLVQDTSYEQQAARQEWLQHPFTQKVLNQFEELKQKTLSIAMNSSTTEDPIAIRNLITLAHTYDKTIKLIKEGE